MDDPELICEECADEIEPGDNRTFNGAVVCSGCADELAVSDDRHPMAWLVYCPDGEEFDYLVFAEKRDAENRAAGYAELHHADHEWAIIPLFAGEPETIAGTKGNP
jgi:hypothetical protein